MELKDTVELMCSADYKERFKAEYLQLKIRYKKLCVMVDKWNKGELNFIPTCPKQIYDIQIIGMKTYLDVLKERAKMENIDVEERDMNENELDKYKKAFDIIKEYIVDIWLLENCDYENYIRIRKECLIENNKSITEDGKITDDVIPENLFNKLKEII